MSRAVLAYGVLAGAIGLAGCNGKSTSTDLDPILGTYSVTISASGKSDPDVMSIAEGAGGGVVFSFVAGISTDLMGPNPNGLGGALDKTAVSIGSQPAHIDHSTGQLDGTLFGEGTLAEDGTTVQIVLHFTPTNLALPDGATSLDYTVDGSKM